MSTEPRTASEHCGVCPSKSENNNKKLYSAFRIRESTRVKVFVLHPTDLGLVLHMAHRAVPGVILEYRVEGQNYALSTTRCGLLHRAKLCFNSSGLWLTERVSALQV